MGYESSFFSSTLGLVILVFALVLLILWTLLPFAIFGIKGKLDELISINRKIHQQLSTLSSDLSEPSGEQDVPDMGTEDVPPEEIPIPSVQICPNCGQKNSRRMTNCTRCGSELKKEPIIE